MHDFQERGTRTDVTQAFMVGWACFAAAQSLPHTMLDRTTPTIPNVEMHHYRRHNGLIFAGDDSDADMHMCSRLCGGIWPPLQALHSANAAQPHLRHRPQHLIHTTEHWNMVKCSCKREGIWDCGLMESKRIAGLPK
jgi:hypothetical protein